MFKIWTEIPLRSGADSDNKIHIAKDRFSALPHCKNDFRAYELQGEKNVKSSDIVLPQLECAMEETGDKKALMGCGLVDINDVKHIVPERVENGAVFAISADSLEYNPYDACSNKDLVRVIVLPLRFYSAIMRMALKTPQRRYDFAHDFRIALLYGVAPYIYNNNAIDIVRQLEGKYKQLHNSARANIMWSKPPKVCELHVVFNGQKLDYKNYCMTCPRNINWATNECAFCKYNCIMPTDHEPGLMTAPNPNMQDFFGIEKTDKKLCIARYPFEAYIAGALQPSEANVRRNKKNAIAADRTGKTRKLYNTICTNCVLNAPDDNCNRRIRHGKALCGGPFFDEDIAGYQDLVVDPWEYHVMFMSGKKFTPQQLDKYFSVGLKRVRNPIVLSAPVTMDLLRSIVMNAAKTLHWRPASKIKLHISKVTSKYMVRLTKCFNSDCAYFIPYKRLCEIAGVEPIFTWDKLINEYPIVSSLDKSVCLAVARELRIPLAYSTLSATRYCLQRNKLIRVVSTSSRQHYVTVNCQSSTVNAIRDPTIYADNRNPHTEQRKAENNAIYELILSDTHKKRKFTGTKVPLFIRDCRSMGIANATEKWRP